MLRRNIKIIPSIIIILITVFLLIQFIPLGKDHTNPPVVSEPKWDSPQTRDLAKRACFDCHSNDTIWPWYSNIAPVSWLVYYDAVGGRNRMNFSNWTTIRLREPAEIASVVSEGEMPPLQYTLIHKTARLSPSEKTQLINGLVKTIGQ
jgi:Haem-binding domain